jgi:hypothetical protein
MTARELAEAYLGALGRADLTAMLSLFSAGRGGPFATVRPGPGVRVLPGAVRRHGGLSAE